MNDPFAPSTENRETIPDSKKKAGFLATQEPHEYFNQALFKSSTDHIWGTSNQVANDDATFYTDASGNPLNKLAGSVTINEDDKILIAHNVTATANMKLICGGKKVRLEMLKGINWDLDTFDLDLGETNDSFSGDIELTGTGTLTIEKSNGFRVHHSAMTVVNSSGDIVVNNFFLADGIMDASGSYSTREKIIPITSWNMHITGGGNIFRLITHGLTMDNIVSVSALIEKDDHTTLKPIDYDQPTTGGAAGYYRVQVTNIQLTCIEGSTFDSVGYSDNVMNRGYVYIKYLI